VTLPAGARAVPDSMISIWPSESLEGRRQLKRAESTAIVVQLGTFLLRCMSPLLADFVAKGS
jgi:hypothetical protein